MLSSRDNADLVLPNPLLSGSVPRLRNLYLDVIALPALPPLLRSAKDLVHLHLQRIPGRGYILPEALVVTSLSAMTKLKFLHMHFASPASRPDPRSTPPPPPVGRGILPSLTHLAFQGAPTNTWRDVMARIGSTPSLSLSLERIFDPSRRSEISGRGLAQVPRSATQNRRVRTVVAVGQHGGVVKVKLAPPRRYGIIYTVSPRSSSGLGGRTGHVPLCLCPRAPRCLATHRYHRVPQAACPPRTQARTRAWQTYCPRYVDSTFDWFVSGWDDAVAPFLTASALKLYYRSKCP